MNERIQELAQQSKLAELYDRYVEQCMKNADDDILDYDVIVKEFAELIIRDIHQYVDGMDTAQVISNGILRRYGVEE
jgi:hypothetical protein